MRFKILLIFFFSEYLFAGTVVFKSDARQWELAGELEYEYTDCQSAPAADETYGHFQIDKLTIANNLDLSETSKLMFEAYFNEDEAKLTKAIMQFSPLESNYTLSFGRFYRFCRMSRYSEAYPLTGTAFWRSRDRGVKLEYDLSGWIVDLSVTDGLELGDKRPSKDHSYDLIYDCEGEAAENKRETGFGLSRKFRDSKVALFHYSGGLSPADITKLNGISTYSSDSDKKYFSGFSIEHKYSFLSLRGQMIKSTDGALNRDTYYAEVLFNTGLKAGMIENTEFVINHSALSTDFAPDPTDSLSWDRTLDIAGIIFDLDTGIKCKLEYYFNGEKTGGASVPNNAFLAQLELKF